MIHLLVGFIQLGAVYRVCTVLRKVPGGDIDDFTSASVAVSVECARDCIPQQGIVSERGDGIVQVVDAGSVGGDISSVLIDAGGVGSNIRGVLRHIFVGGKQLRAVNGVGAVCSQGTRRQVGDFTVASVVLSAECARGCIPKQGIIGERGDGVAQTVDIGGVGGDISGVLIDAGGVGSDVSGVLRHIFVGGKQLRAVNGVGAVSSQGTRRQIGDFTVASVVLSAECARGCIPKQGIVGERGDGVAQAVDIGGVGGDISGVLIDAGRIGGDIGCVLIDAVGIGGDISGVLVNAVGIGGDISSVLIHFLVRIKQLGAVNGVGAVCGQGACRQIGDFAGVSRVASAKGAGAVIPQQRVFG